jgi:hypothetical protein
MDNNQLQIYVQALVNTNDTFEALKNRYTETLADLVSFKNNPNCSCKARVNAFIAKKYMEIPEEKAFIDELIKNPDVVRSYDTLSKLPPSRPGNIRNLSGQIFKVPKGDEGWAALSRDIAGAMFRSFNVVDRGDYSEVYFL